MAEFNVSVPENKKSFFLEFLKLIGAKYQEKKDFENPLTEEQKTMIDNRLDSKSEEFIPAREALIQLREKYGI